VRYGDTDGKENAEVSTAAPCARALYYPGASPYFPHPDLAALATTSKHVARRLAQPLEARTNPYEAPTSHWDKVSHRTTFL
jgi:hypothetical protein